MNKWENGNSNPDIELLAPIARLLHISLDTLLSFHENLTDVEITELIQEMDKMFSVEGYEKTYQWAVNIIKDYPNCNMLIWIAGFQNEEDFAYMKGYKPWKKLLAKY